MVSVCPSTGDALPASCAVGLALGHDLQFKLRGLAVAALDAYRADEELESYALGLGLGNLLGVGGHVLAGTAVHDGDVLRAQTHGGAGGVDGDVAAADYDGVLAHGRRARALGAAKQLEAAHNAAVALAGYAQRDGLPGADGEEEGLIALAAQLIERDVLADLDAGLELYAYLAQDVYLGGDDVLLKPEAGYAVLSACRRRSFAFQTP